MTRHAQSTFEVKKWDEHTVDDVDGTRKITRASVAFAYHGALEAEGSMEYLMAYGEDGSATVLGLERIKGRLEGKAGTFVVQYRGGYANGVARADLTIVDGSGTAELAGLRGQGTSTATSDGKTSLQLDYELS